MEKTPHIKHHEALKKSGYGSLIKSFSDEKPKKSIDLTDDEIESILMLCENGIKENEDLINDLQDGKEKEAWIDTNNFLRGLINNIKKNFFEKCGSQQFVLQQLTPKQEDYILEQALDDFRERREATADLMRKYNEVDIEK